MERQKKSMVVAAFMVFVVALFLPKVVGAGDLDADCDVDFDDFLIFKSTYGMRTGNSGYNPECDFDGDGWVGLNDYFEWYWCYQTFNLSGDRIVANDDIAWVAEGRTQAFNLILVMDVSGNMEDMINGKTRLALTKEVNIQLLQAYEALGGDLQVTIVPFASNTGNNGAFAKTFTDVNDAISFIQDSMDVEMYIPIGIRFPNAASPAILN